MKLDVCLSLKLIDNYELNDTVVIIIDVVRASSTISTAIHYGVEHIVALSDIEQTRKLKDEGYITAGERGGDKVDGFDFGNSPLTYTNRSIFEGQKLAITTTNGTRTLKLVEKAAKKFENCEILVGAFINSDAIKKYILSSSKNVLLVCSGWQANLSIEDTLFAGKLAKELLSEGNYNVMSDSTVHSTHLYNIAKDNLFDFVLDSSTRFSGKPGSLADDIRYCLRTSIIDTIPILKNGKIKKNSKNSK